MEIRSTPIEGLFILKPKIFEDPRGFFFESYSEQALKNNGINYSFVQDNQSKSSKNVIRGLHYQLAPHAQTKLVRVLQGTIYDVAVDVRKNSSTYGIHFGIELSAENKLQLLIPKGFAHGFSVLSETAEIMYKCDEFYHPECDAGIHFADKTLNIEWGVNASDAIVSLKDTNLPTFANALNNF